jgi:hypothetical protein
LTSLDRPSYVFPNAENFLFVPGQGSIEMRESEDQTPSLILGFVTEGGGGAGGGNRAKKAKKAKKKKKAAQPSNIDPKARGKIKAAMRDGRLKGGAFRKAKKLLGVGFGKETTKTRSAMSKFASDRGL